MSAEAKTAEDRNVDIWKVKKLIKSLEAARGSVASCAARAGAPALTARSSTRRQQRNEHDLAHHPAQGPGERTWGTKIRAFWRLTGDGARSADCAREQDAGG